MACANMLTSHLRKLLRLQEAALPMRDDKLILIQVDGLVRNLMVANYHLAPLHLLPLRGELAWEQTKGIWIWA